MGEYLAEQILKHYSGRDHDIDVVIPIPDTGRTAALPLAHELNTKYRGVCLKSLHRAYVHNARAKPKEEIC